jgi:hypothetical protein
MTNKLTPYSPHAVLEGGGKSTVDLMHCHIIRSFSLGSFCQRLTAFLPLRLLEIRAVPSES